MDCNRGLISILRGSFRFLEIFIYNYILSRGDFKSVGSQQRLALLSLQSCHVPRHCGLLKPFLKNGVVGVLELVEMGKFKVHKCTGNTFWISVIVTGTGTEISFCFDCCMLVGEMFVKIRCATLLDLPVLM